MKQNFLLAFLLILSGAVCSSETLTAHWDFSKSQHSVKQSFQMQMRGNTSLQKDHSGSFLRITSDGKKPAGIIAKKIYRELSPAGGFRVEVKFRLHAGKKKNHTYLLDNKYVGYFHKNPDFNRGFIVSLIRTGKTTDVYFPQVHLGQGKSSIALRGPNKVLKAGEIHTLSFSWDGSGTARFLWNGKQESLLYIKNAGPVAPARYPLVIGDRVHSSHLPFNGDIYDVKLYTFPAKERGLNVRADRRRVFLRNEKNAALVLDLENGADSDVTNVVLRADLGGSFRPLQKIPLIRKGENKVITLPVETRLTPAWRNASVTVNYTCGGKQRRETLNFRWGIAPLTHDRMPVVMWGFSLPHTLFKEYGFTHGMKYSYMGIFTARSPRRYDQLPGFYRELDAMLMNSFRGVGSFHVDRFKKEYPRIGRDGKPYQNNQNFDAAHPEGAALVSSIAEEAAKAYSDHIGLDGLLINSEVRDRSRPSFGKHNLAQWQAHSGMKNIPEGVAGRSAPHWSSVEGFPLSRIIDPADTLLNYYKFFWHSGDGWNPVHTRIHNAFKKNIKHKHFWTFYDPAVRVPPLWGSGGKVDYLSHWTYTNPDPINIMANTAEMFAMQKGDPSQGVMNMTQIICYRSLTAPVGKKVANEPAWVKKFPKAPYITLSPDMMQEALWAQITRKVSGIMFHGSNSLFTDPAYLGDTGYQCTHQGTKEVLKKFLLNVIRPLGGLLKRIPERPSRIGVLESFASHVYAGRGSMGWSTWVFDLNVALHWANLQYSVIYEQAVLKGALDDLDVLIMPHCDVLPKEVYEKIVSFQKRGGILVADQYVTPALLPDLSVKAVYKNRFNPLESKKKLQETVLQIRKGIAPYHKPYTETTNADLVTYVRSDKNADYLFVINDKRVFGDYFGPYGMVAEKGVPNRGTVRLRRTDVGAVYDLVKGIAVPFRKKGAFTLIDVNFSTNDGRLYLILPQKIRSLNASLDTKRIAVGRDVTLNASLNGSLSRISTLHPLRVTVTDPAGRVTDDSAWGVMENGSYTHRISVPLDGKKGLWRVTLRELASGKSSTLTFTVY